MTLFKMHLYQFKDIENWTNKMHHTRFFCHGCGWQGKKYCGAILHALKPCALTFSNVAKKVKSYADKLAKRE